MLEFLYQTALGRCILKLLTRPGLSKAAGRFMDSRLSKPIIPRFIRSNGIKMSDYLEEDYSCFNDFFCRRIRPELRPIDMNENHLIAPCDGLLSAYPIQDSLVIPVKGSRYSIPDLLQDTSLASKYENGTCLVFRLCVHHYHRYIYGSSGVKGKNIFIPGVLHTVRPVALREVPVFKENSREYTVIHSQNFGDMVQMEVGAMLVGKIDNYHPEKEVHRGEEKGRFLYGGSTIILLLEPNTAEVNEEYFQATEQGMETEIKMGQMIGMKKRDSRS